MTYKIAALYKFTPLEDLPALRARIQDFANACENMCGTILLAPEGINGTIGAPPEALDRMIAFLDSLCGIQSGELKYSAASARPFNRFKVRLKKEIITMKCPQANPARQVGTYVEADAWNDLLADPDVVLVDTRNIYETEVGTFQGAIDPRLTHFSQFPAWVEENLDAARHKKVAMFCTGGIRCEKASSYMLAQGFENVYHLKGGILKYLETVSSDRSAWRGECFVFDRRVTVTHGLEEGSCTICHGCREPLLPADTQSPLYEEGICCARCAPDLTPERRAALKMRHGHYTARQADECA